MRAAPRNFRLSRRSIVRVETSMTTTADERRRGEGAARWCRAWRRRGHRRRSAGAARADPVAGALPDVLVALMLGALRGQLAARRAGWAWRARSRAQSLRRRPGLRRQDGPARLGRADGAAHRGEPVSSRASCWRSRVALAAALADHVPGDARAGHPAARAAPAGRPDRRRHDDLRRLGRQRRGAGHRRAPPGAGRRAGDDLPVQRGRAGRCSARSRPCSAWRRIRAGSGAAWPSTISPARWPWAPRWARAAPRWRRPASRRAS